MYEFICNHLDAIASIVTILGGMGALIAFLWVHLDKRFTKIDVEIKEIKEEQQKFHTRLTWLDGYIAGNETHDKKRK